MVKSVQAVREFQGQYRFLSNFWPCRVVLDREVYSSIEHAYQAAKTTDPVMRGVIRLGTAAEAKRIGKDLSRNPRPGWNDAYKLKVMRDLVEQKFTVNRVLRQQLLDTGAAELVEGNWWHDQFWGVCRGKGLNHLGKILMEVRVLAKKGEVI